MSIRVLLFAGLAEATGTRETLVNAESCPNVGSIFDGLARRFPKLESHRASLLCSLNSEFARPDAPVHDGDEVAFFPPVSGG